MNAKSDLTRRDVVRTGLSAAAATAVAGGRADAAAGSIPRKWDYDTDVICVGYGGAGANAAIAARDRGSRVVVIEKLARGGGNTAVSSGGFLCPTDADRAFEHLSQLLLLSRREADPELLRAFVDGAVKTADWIASLKENTALGICGRADFPRLEGADAMRQMFVTGAADRAPAENLWEVYVHAVEEKRKITVMTDTSAKRLLSNEDGEIIAVVAEQKGREIAIRARQAVVLTTGGYEFDPDALRNSCKGFPIHSLGSPGNTGDGVRMAQQVGAGQWHMNACNGTLGLKPPDVASAFHIGPIARHPACIIVDRHGRRFVDESAIDRDGLWASELFDPARLEFPRIPCYAIFDETARLAGPFPLVPGPGYAGRRYAWSSDNAAEIDRGWIIIGETVARLAGKLNMDPTELRSTLTRWNRDVRAGRDGLFHRPMLAPKNDPLAKTDGRRPIWSAALERPPFYAAPLYPVLFNTCGGPRRNVRGQVIDAFGSPIPRLYSAGELGSIGGVIPQHGSNNAESMVFGQIAGRNAGSECRC